MYAARDITGIEEAQVRGTRGVGDVPQIQPGSTRRLVGQPAVLQANAEQVAVERIGVHGDDLHIFGGGVRVSGRRSDLARVGWVSDIDDLDSGAGAGAAPGADIREAVVRIHVRVETSGDMQRAGQARPPPGCRVPPGWTEPLRRRDDALLNG